MQLIKKLFLTFSSLIQILNQVHGRRQFLLNVKGGKNSVYKLESRYNLKFLTTRTLFNQEYYLFEEKYPQEQLNNYNRRSRHINLQQKAKSYGSFSKNTEWLQKYKTHL